MANTTDRAPTPLVPHLNGQVTNMSVNLGITKQTDRAPTPMPTGINMSVNLGMAIETDRASTPMQTGIHMSVNTETT